AIEEVRQKLGQTYPLLIAGQEIRGNLRLLDSSDPSRSSRIVSRTAAATAEHAQKVIAAARSAVPAWAATPARDRAGVLVKAAGIMRQRRFELAAWEIFECGKPWREADADAAEAIDFCEFYAREMIRLAEPRRRDVSGETNTCEHLPRGVAVVIPPWNFPLAIPCGMTVAALVTGNTVVLKPAEQSPVVAWHLVQILIEAGVPPGALSYLPGRGEEVGQALVNHPGVDLIAFTGSREVGLLINRQAADTRPGQDHVKRVIAEMGGKNAIIVDDDADLDEAVVGVVQSAFGYSGQKCSACSRVIVLEGIHDAFLARLVEAARPTSPRPSSDQSSTPRPASVSSVTADSPRRKGGSSSMRMSASWRTSVPTLATSSWPMSRHLRGSPRRRSSARCWPFSRPAIWTRPCKSPTEPSMPSQAACTRAVPSISTASNASSRSATSTSTGESPGPLSIATPSAASSSPASVPRPAARTTSSSFS